ncbi:MAG: oligosaccharide flippase family protein [Betaproteobacteria bacterium]|nr:oligosaccharide flippase family protein [Betaproteobacteria bacterium]
MSQLKKNILSNFLGQSALILIGFVSFKYVYTSLGEDGLGIIYFSLMLSTLLTAALDLGMTKTTMRELAGYQATDSAYVTKLLQTFSTAYWLAYLLLSLVFALSVPLIIGSWVKLTTMSPSLAGHVLLIIGTSSLLAIPKAFLSSICVGFQRMHINNSINVFVAILQQAGIIILLARGGDIISVAYWIAATNVLNVLVYLSFVSSFVPPGALLPKVSTDVIRKVKDYSVIMAWISLLAVIYKQFDKLLISMLLPIGVLGIYSFAYMTVTKLTLITDAIAQAIFPVFSELEYQQNQTKSHQRFFALQDLLTFGLAPLFALMVFLTLPVFTFLMDKTKAEALLLPMLFLSIGFYLNGALRLLSTYVSASGKPIYIIRSILLLLIVVSPITVLLIREFGMSGAAFSWVVTSVVNACYLVPNVYQKELHKTVGAWLRPIITVTVMVCITYLPAWFLAKFVFSNNLLYLVSFYVVASMVYCFLAINFSTSGFREAFLRHVPGVNFLVLPHRKSS